MQNLYSNFVSSTSKTTAPAAAAAAGSAAAVTSSTTATSTSSATAATTAGSDTDATVAAPSSPEPSSELPRKGITIFVGGSSAITEEFLKTTFSKFGAIINISMEVEKK